MLVEEGGYQIYAVNIGLGMTERPSLGPSHPSEEQIRSRVDGPGRHEKNRATAQTRTGFQFFSAL